MAKDFHFASISHLKAELQSIYDFCMTTPHTPLTWDRIYILLKMTHFFYRKLAIKPLKIAKVQYASWLHGIIPFLPLIHGRGYVLSTRAFLKSPAKL